MVRRWRRSWTGSLTTVLATAVAAIVVTGLLAPVAPANGPDGFPAGPAWTAAQDAPPQYPGVHIDWDVPIRMSDGTILKSNVYRPMDASGRIVDTPLPTIVNLTPYTKLASMVLDSALSVPILTDVFEAMVNRFDLFDLQGTPASGIGDIIRTASGGFFRSFTADRRLIRSGYTMVMVDVRGTGFSEGVWEAFGHREQQDTLEVIDWASHQPWSDGKIGMAGVSYSGINQIMAAQANPPALRAIFPVIPSSDLIRDTVAPGGGVGVGFIPLWLALVNGLKLVPDAASILTGQFDWKWLLDRVQSPITFIDLLVQALFVTSVDSIPEHLKKYLDPQGYFRTSLLGHPENITIPTFVVGGWHDLFADSQTRIYNAIPLPPGHKQLLMGDWYHLIIGSGLGTPGAPPRLDALQRAWFDKWLKGIDNGIDSYGPVTLWQQGGQWTTTDQFPRAGMEYRRHYLSADHSGTTTGIVAHDGTLTDTPPAAPATLTVAPGLATMCSRDTAQITIAITSPLDACAKDSRIAEVAALTFTGPVVDRPTLISGPVNIHLNTVLDATDGYWNATLNDVAPDGTSTVLTTGQLTASLRAIDDATSGKSPNGDYTDPHYPLTLPTRQPVVPGQPTVLDLGLTATDAVLQPGHRLRVDIYANNFPKGMLAPTLMWESQFKPQHLLLDPQAPSWINLPSR
ncbi:CocE/NonD family hydrolase [Nocardia transvalensis]|uniref:CocE/NonD family hydrolase n=1 Tax=Nocardia transvalensis TaxID=37333 RepID=UPI001893E598|nr:CocE/NonD family hydrolase [Nocardia transvalensis]MBF6331092.1 CocE/NonD family hydrolase [Nocardia transvalensis]